MTDEFIRIDGTLKSAKLEGNADKHVLTIEVEMDTPSDATQLEILKAIQTNNLVVATVHLQGV